MDWLDFTVVVVFVTNVFAPFWATKPNKWAQSSGWFFAVVFYLFARGILK